MSKCMELLTVATTAIRDHYVGFPDDEIVAPSGNGIKTLLSDLVSYLRENGVDDEGGWDCDATEGIEVRSAPSFKPFKLVVEAYATSEFGEGPEFAVVTVTPEFIDKLVRLRRVCKEHDLESLTIGMAPDMWDQEGDLRIRNNSLRVWGADFWFEAHPKHADYNVETKRISIGDLAFVATLGMEGACFKRIGETVLYAESDEGMDHLQHLLEEGVFA